MLLSLTCIALRRIRLLLHLVRLLRISWRWVHRYRLLAIYVDDSDRVGRWQALSSSRKVHWSATIQHVYLAKIVQFSRFQQNFAFRFHRSLDWRAPDALHASFDRWLAKFHSFCRLVSFEQLSPGAVSHSWLHWGKEPVWLLQGMESYVCLPSMLTLEVGPVGELLKKLRFLQASQCS